MPERESPAPASPLLGAHMSIAGGFHNAVDAAARAGCGTVQVFTKNNNQWAARPITDDQVGAFRGALDRTGITRPSCASPATARSRNCSCSGRRSSSGKAP